MERNTGNRQGSDISRSETRLLNEAERLGLNKPASRRAPRTGTGRTAAAQRPPPAMGDELCSFPSFHASSPSIPCDKSELVHKTNNRHHLLS